ncbi:hypothetical protein C2G38_2180695 [Gigaspora rosea]|uniref:BTB domain-containing protein n=1 Tax=Gigaspora rosea TaxID=44941 RepID=A0A397VEY1_9GLOM|nr:hypothetical protein C2G38_2180695 [Gigaspora rosea]
MSGRGSINNGNKRRLTCYKKFFNEALVFISYILIRRNSFIHLQRELVCFEVTKKIVILKVGESSNTKIFQAHSAILRYRFLYFRKKLETINKDENNIKPIILKHISIQQFEVIIKYIYGGMILLEDYEVSFIFKLMFFAHEFFLSLDSADFTSLQENALISLLKRDDLQMEEGKILNYVIKWGIAQNQGFPSDPEDWTPENFQALKKTTLQNCLPLIRYFQICEPFSTIINEEHIAEIASWVDEKTITYSTKNNPYEFRLLHRGIKDTDEILGGYNPIGWEKPISYKFIICDKTVGTTFYDDLFCFDRCNRSWCRHESYEKPIRNVPVNPLNRSYFSLEDYEIFQVNKKHVD